MPIENRELAAGTRLVARYKKTDRTCEVVETPNGPRYRLDDGTEYRSPSSAGKAAMDGVACNGWVFWSIEGTKALKREPTVGETAKAKKKVAANGLAKKSTGSTTTVMKKSAKTGKAGSTRTVEKKSDAFGCGACGENFPTMKDATEHALTHTT